MSTNREFLDIFIDEIGNVSLRASVIARTEEEAEEVTYEILDILADECGGLDFRDAQLSMTVPSDGGRWVVRWLGLIDPKAVPLAQIKALEIHDMLDRDRETGIEDAA